ncbi:MAG: hypothetical protein V1727_04045 [Candidatus Omnitrophota bacterium]
MGKNKKILLLAFLGLAALIIWLPKGKKSQPAGQEANAFSSVALTEVKLLAREGTKFTQWGRSPFIWPEQERGAKVHFSLAGIVWDAQQPYALVNGEVVHVGDQIEGMRVTVIEPASVTLNNGAQDIILNLE